MFSEIGGNSFSMVRNLTQGSFPGKLIGRTDWLPKRYQHAGKISQLPLTVLTANNKSKIPVLWPTRILDERRMNSSRKQCAIEPRSLNLRFRNHRYDRPGIVG